MMNLTGRNDEVERTAGPEKTVVNRIQANTLVKNDGAGKSVDPESTAESQGNLSGEFPSIARISSGGIALLSKGMFRMQCSSSSVPAPSET